MEEVAFELVLKALVGFHLNVLPFSGPFSIIRYHDLCPKELTSNSMNSEHGGRSMNEVFSGQEVAFISGH